MSEKVEFDKIKNLPYGLEHREAIQLFPELTDQNVTFGKEVTIIAGGGGKEATDKPLDLARIRAAMDPRAGIGFESLNNAALQNDVPVGPLQDPVIIKTS